MSDKFEKGNIITAYHKGYHRITEIKGNEVFYTKVMNADFKTSKVIKESCHIDWCKKVNKEDLLSQLHEAISLIDTLFNT